MTEAQIMDLLREGLLAATVASTPLLGVALVVGLGIGLVQALTSVQEMTLTFVPKLAALAVTFWVTMSFMGRQFTDYWAGTVIPTIAGGGG